MRGFEIVARCLKERQVEHVFYLMGAPMLDVELSSDDLGIKLIDVRHEQAAAMMGIAYTRLLRRPAVCMAAAGPGVMNLVTGVATAYADGAPLVVLGGSYPQNEIGLGSFQEMDQVGVFKPITRWSERCTQTERLPEFIERAFANAFGSRPGPVYLDLPGDVLYRDVDESTIKWTHPLTERAKPLGAPDQIEAAIELLIAAERPVLMTGTGILWSGAEAALRDFVDAFGVPFYATPQGRGAVPESHEYSYLGARGKAFKETDLIVLVGTRQSYVTEFTRPPRWNGDAKLIQVDIDPVEIGRTRRPDAGIVGDAGAVLKQLVEAGRGGAADPLRYAAWRADLSAVHKEKAETQEEWMSTDASPIHPLRLCKEIRDFLPEDAILAVDGQEILTFARQSIPFDQPVSLNSGPFGCMGVGLPLGLGAKVAMPDRPVLVLHGDGSFGLNAMEMDTAIRHNIPVVCVISNNAGWTGRTPKVRMGRELGHTRYDEMFAPIGCHTEFVENADDIRPALERAFASGKPAVVNVITDPGVRSQSSQFTLYAT